MKKKYRRLSRRKFIKNVTAAGTVVTMTGLSLPDLKAQGKNAVNRPICIFSKHLQWLNYDEMADVCAKIGFDGVDLTVRPGGHVLPENVTVDLVQAKKAVDRAGLAMPMITTAITDPDDPVTKKILQTARDCGIKYYRMGYLHYKKEMAVDTCLEQYKPLLADLARLNEICKIHGAYQNHAGTNIGAPVWDLWLLMRDLNPDWIGCQYDIRHATVEGANSWPIALNLLHSYIRCMVIKDFKWANIDGDWRIENVPVGEGMVDFRRYFLMLKELNITGPISLHYEYPVLTESDNRLSLTDKKKKTIEIMKRDLIKVRKMLEEI